MPSTPVVRVAVDGVAGTLVLGRPLSGDSAVKRTELVSWKRRRASTPQPPGRAPPRYTADGPTPKAVVYNSSKWGEAGCAALSTLLRERTRLKRRPRCEDSERWVTAYRPPPTNHSPAFCRASHRRRPAHSPSGEPPGSVTQNLGRICIASTSCSRVPGWTEDLSNSRADVGVKSTVR